MFNRSYINGHKNHPHYLTNTQLVSFKKRNDLSPDIQTIRIIKNLSDPTKLKIYLLLSKVREISVTDLTAILGMSQSTVSHALADLKNLELIDCHRCGKLICYFIKNQKNNQKIAKFFGKFTSL